VQRSCGSFNNREPGHSHASIIAMCVCVLCMYACRVLRLLQVYYMPRIWNVCAKSHQTLESYGCLRTWQIDLFISTGYRPQMSGRIIVLSSPPRISVLTKLVYYCSVIHYTPIRLVMIVPRSTRVNLLRK